MAINTTKSLIIHLIIHQGLGVYIVDTFIILVFLHVRNASLPLFLVMICIYIMLILALNFALIKEQMASPRSDRHPNCLLCQCRICSKNFI